MCGEPLSSSDVGPVSSVDIQHSVHGSQLLTCMGLEVIDMHGWRHTRDVYIALFSPVRSGLSALI